jgi:hypothetical protein
MDELARKRRMALKTNASKTTRTSRTTRARTTIAAKTRGILPPDWGVRFAAERARLQLHYCNLFKFWLDCRDKRCRRHLRCCGNAGECLKRRIGEVPRHAQFQARQAILLATPQNAGGAERTVRQFMPYDVITPDPLQAAAQFEARRR